MAYEAGGCIVVETKPREEIGMSHGNFYHGRRKRNETPPSTSLYARHMFFFALVVMFAAALYKNPF